MTLGALTIDVMRNDVDDWPGFVIRINGQCAAVVEWHAIIQDFVLRTYVADGEEPHHYHTWHGHDVMAPRGKAERTRYQCPSPNPMYRPRCATGP